MNPARSRATWRARDAMRRNAAPGHGNRQGRLFADPSAPPRHAQLAFSLYLTIFLPPLTFLSRSPLTEAHFPFLRSLFSLSLRR
jgi:hypothetical protein